MTEEHPTYGTCPHCTQGKRLKKGGWLPEHNTPSLVYSDHAVAHYRCPGSGKRYAEYDGYYWDLKLGEFRRQPTRVPLKMHQRESGVAEDQFLTMAYYDEKFDAVLRHWDNEGIELHARILGDEDMEAVLELWQGTTKIKEATVDHDGASPSGKVLNWLYAAHGELGVEA